MSLDDPTIDFTKKLGSGTHGIIYQSKISPDIVVKVVPYTTNIPIKTCFGNKPLTKQMTSCDIIKNFEFSTQERASEALIQAKKRNIIHEDLKDLIDIPKVYGYKFIPNSSNPQYCSYLMDRLKFLHQKGLIQLSFNYDRKHFSIEPSGVYMGLDTLREFLHQIIKDDVDTIILDIVEVISSTYAIFHYGMKSDAYDVEFVLSLNKDDKLTVYAIDYDKFSNISVNYPYCIARKLTETDYDIRNISNDNQLARTLQTSLGYSPLFGDPEYQVWEEAYLDTASFYGMKLIAEKVVEFYRSKERIS